MNTNDNNPRKSSKASQKTKNTNKKQPIYNRNSQGKNLKSNLKDQQRTPNNLRRNPINNLAQNMLHNRLPRLNQNKSSNSNSFFNRHFNVFSSNRGLASPSQNLSNENTETDELNENQEQISSSFGKKGGGIVGSLLNSKSQGRMPEMIGKTKKLTLIIRILKVLLPIIIVFLVIIVFLSLIISVVNRFAELFSIDEWIEDDAAEVEGARGSNEQKFNEKLKNYIDKYENCGEGLNDKLLLSTIFYTGSNDQIYDEESTSTYEGENPETEEDAYDDSTKKLKSLVKNMIDESGSSCTINIDKYDNYLREKYIPKYMDYLLTDDETRDGDIEKIINEIHDQVTAYEFWSESENDCVTVTGDKQKVRLTHYQHQGSDNSLGGTIGLVQPYINQGVVYEDENGLLMWKGGNNARGKTYGQSGTDYLIVATATELLIGQYGFTRDENIRYFKYGDTFKLEVSFASNQTSKVYDAIALDACGACMDWSITSNGRYSPKNRDDAAETNNMKIDIFTQPKFTPPADYGYFIDTSIGDSNTSSSSNNTNNSTNNTNSSSYTNDKIENRIYYTQHDYTQSYCEGDNATIKSGGCLPTAFSMVVSNLYDKPEITPVTLRDYICNNVNGAKQYRVKNRGTNNAFLRDAKTQEYFQVSTTTINKSEMTVDNIKSILASNKMIIASVGGGKGGVGKFATSSGHYIVLSNLGPNNEILVLDPNKRSESGYHSDSVIQREVIARINSGMWAIEATGDGAINLNELGATNNCSPGTLSGIRTSLPSRNNPSEYEFYYSGAVSANSGCSVGQCVWYVRGRAYEIMVNAGISNEEAKAKINSFGGNANQMYANNISAGAFNYSDDVTKPKAGSIVAWSGGSYGHVAVIEAVNGSGSDMTVTISETNWTSSNTGCPKESEQYGFHTETISIDRVKKRGRQTFMGYIYILD